MAAEDWGYAGLTVVGEVLIVILIALCLAIVVFGRG